MSTPPVAAAPFSFVRTLEEKQGLLTPEDRAHLDQVFERREFLDKMVTRAFFGRVVDNFLPDDIQEAKKAGVKPRAMTPPERRSGLFKSNAMALHMASTVFDILHRIMVGHIDVLHDFKFKEPLFLGKSNRVREVDAQTLPAIFRRVWNTPPRVIEKDGKPTEVYDLPGIADEAGELMFARLEDIKSGRFFTKLGEQYDLTGEEIDNSKILFPYVGELVKNAIVAIPAFSCFFYDLKQAYKTILERHGVQQSEEALNDETFAYLTAEAFSFSNGPHCLATRSLMLFDEVAEQSKQLSLSWLGKLAQEVQESNEALAKILRLERVGSVF